MAPIDPHVIYNWLLSWLLRDCLCWLEPEFGVSVWLRVTVGPRKVSPWKLTAMDPFLLGQPWISTHLVVFFGGAFEVTLYITMGWNKPHKIQKAGIIPMTQVNQNPLSSLRNCTSRCGHETGKPVSFTLLHRSGVPWSVRRSRCGSGKLQWNEKESATQR